MQPGERTGEPADRVAYDRRAKRGVALDVLVRVDHDRADLRREALDDVRHERASGEVDEALIDAAHAASATTGEDDAGDVGTVDHRSHRSQSSRRCALYFT